MTVDTIGIEMPSDFPVTAYNDAHSYVQPLQPRFPAAYSHNAGAINAVAIRFRAMAEADEIFESTLTNVSPSPEERFRQEVALFTFFTNAVSILDSCGYALYALANMIDPVSFPLTGQGLRNDFRRVNDLFQRQFPIDPISAILAATDTDNVAAELRDLRNFLAHRIASTRAYNTSSPEVQWHVGHMEPSSGLKTLKIERDLTRRYRIWMADRLAAIFPQVSKFVQSRL